MYFMTQVILSAVPGNTTGIYVIISHYLNNLE